METITINRFSIHDILNAAGVVSGINAIALTDSTKLTELLAYYGFNLVQGVLPFNPETDATLIKFINGFVKSRDDLIVSESESELSATNEDILNGFLEKFIVFLNRSYPYYSQMITLYESKKAQLMNDLTYSITKDEANGVTGSGNTTASGTSGNTNTEDTESKQGESDMPQTTAFASAPSTDDTLSKLTQVKNTGTITDAGTTSDTSHTNTASDETKHLTETRTNPKDTIAKRLKEVEESIRNYYADWYDDFVKAFVLY